MRHNQRDMSSGVQDVPMDGQRLVASRVGAPGIDLLQMIHELGSDDCHTILQTRLSNESPLSRQPGPE